MKKKLLIPIIIIVVLIILITALYFSITRSREIIYMNSGEIDYSDVINNIKINDWNSYSLSINDEDIEPVLVGIIRDNIKAIKSLDDVTISGIELNDNAVNVQAFYKRNRLKIPINIHVNVDNYRNEISFTITKITLGIIPIKSNWILDETSYNINISEYNLPVDIENIDIKKSSLSADFSLNNKNVNTMLYDFINKNTNDIVIDEKLENIDEQEFEINSQVVENTINEYLVEYLESNPQQGLVTFEDIKYYAKSSTIDVLINFAGIKINAPIECSIFIDENILHVDIIRVLNVNNLVSGIIEAMISEFSIDLNDVGIPSWVTVNSMVINPETTTIVYSIDTDTMYSTNSSNVFSIIGLKQGDIFPFSIAFDTFSDYIKKEAQSLFLNNSYVAYDNMEISISHITMDLSISNNSISVQLPYEISANESIITIASDAPSKISINGFDVPQSDLDEIFSDTISQNIDISSILPTNLLDLSDINIDEQKVNLGFKIN